MKNVLLPIIVWHILIAPACSSSTDRPTKRKELTTPEKAITTTYDTSLVSYPMRIGNASGTVEIRGQRSYKDAVLHQSEFSIELNGFDYYSLVRKINKATLIDSVSSRFHSCPIDSQYFSSAVVKNITYRGIRSNTLFFNAVLESPEEEKEIYGRFNLFYRTAKKGKVYGWISDSVKTIPPVID